MYILDDTNAIFAPINAIHQYIYPGSDNPNELGDFQSLLTPITTSSGVSLSLLLPTSTPAKSPTLALMRPFNVYVHPDFAWQPYEAYHRNYGLPTSVMQKMTQGEWVAPIALMGALGAAGSVVAWRFGLAPEALSGLLKPLGL